MHPLKPISYVGILVGLFAAGYFISSCRPRPGQYETLAELTDSSGNRIIIKQEHYSWSEGWVVFTEVTLDGKFYGSLLQMETSRWRNVKLSSAEDVVSIWRGSELVGMLNLRNRIFGNCLNKTYDWYIDKDPSVQIIGIAIPSWKSPVQVTNGAAIQWRTNF